MTEMNKVMKPEQMARDMQEFTKQSMKMEMTEEMSKCIGQLRLLWREPEGWENGVVEVACQTPCLSGLYQVE